MLLVMLVPILTGLTGLALLAFRRVRPCGIGLLAGSILWGILLVS